MKELCLFTYGRKRKKICNTNCVYYDKCARRGSKEWKEYYEALERVCATEPKLYNNIIKS